MQYFLVPVLLAMEFCPRGNLKDFLIASRVNEEHTRQYKNIYSKITERQLINFAAEIARGMMFLFEKEVSKTQHYSLYVFSLFVYYCNP